MSVSDKYGKDRSVNRKVRVVIVDDSVVVRGMFSKWLKDVDNIELIATHRNGKLAVDNIAEDNPDVVLLDIEMPEMDGMTALPLLLENCPSAKIVISSTLTTRNADISLKAMALGAVDYVAKPVGSGGLSGSKGFKEELIQKILIFGGAIDPKTAGMGAKSGFRAAGAVKPKFSGSNAATSRVAGSAANIKPTKVTSSKVVIKGVLHPISKMLPKAIVIGSSTGGPPALLEVTKAITKEIDHIPVFITQHMPASFTKILAQHISKATGRACKEAEHDEDVVNGVIYVAPGGKHMSLAGSGFSIKIKLDDGPQINFCKPSVDPLFITASKIFKKSLLSIILTGMGSDGTGGAGVVVKNGGTVIVQDEESSVVWGMPGAAVQEGVVSEILPLNRIGAKVLNLVRGRV